MGGAHADAIGNLSTAFAFSYCLSLILFVLLMKLPDLLGRNTPRAAQALEAQIRGTLSDPLPGTGYEFLGRSLPVAVRSYLMEDQQLVGHRIGELRRTYPLVSVEHVLREGQVIEPTDDVVLQPHDTLALYGPIPRLIKAATILGPEVDIPELRDTQSETIDVIAHNAEAIGKSLNELAGDIGHGLYLNAMFRGGAEIPHGPDTIVSRG